MSARALGSLVILALILGGCASTPSGDATAKRRVVDPDSVPDAVPRVEPYSRYGNPPSYEVFGKRYAVLPSSRGFVQTGVASWYGEDFHGKRASNGETYDMFAMTAAHKELPLPTYARVTNLDNGRSIVVRITDRGPFVGDRVIDLSWVAAAKLGLVTRGTGLVEVRAIDPLDPNPLPPAELDSGVRYASVSASSPARAPSGTGASARAPDSARAPAVPATAKATATPAGPKVFVQVAALANRDNADRLRSKVAKDLGRPAQVTASEANGRALHRVRIGPVRSADEAELLVARIESLGLGQPRVVMD